MNKQISNLTRQNFIAKAVFIARQLPLMQVADFTSFLRIDCGIPSNTFNVVVLRDDYNIAHVLAHGVDHFTVKGFPIALWCWESVRQFRVHEALLQRGLVHTETNIAMYMDDTTVVSQIEQPQQFTIVQASDSAMIQQYGEVLSGLFGNRPEATHVYAYYRYLGGLPLQKLAHMPFFLGYYAGEVVAIGSLFVDEQTVGIYDLITRRQWRKQGFGTAMFYHLLEQAKQFRRKYCVLQASPDGISIYSKAGFIPTCNVAVYETRS